MTCARRGTTNRGPSSLSRARLDRLVQEAKEMAKVISARRASRKERAAYATAPQD
jgi:hypothetical protein